MANYSNSPRARRDLRDIWLHIGHDSPRAADRLLDRIDARCRDLADNPYLGRARPELGPDTRSWVVGRYLILYRPAEGGVEVVRVVHGARDLDAIEG